MIKYIHLHFIFIYLIENYEDFSFFDDFFPIQYNAVFVQILAGL
jgi:hypothetical protein